MNQTRLLKSRVCHVRGSSFPCTMTRENHCRHVSGLKHLKIMTGFITSFDMGLKELKPFQFGVLI